MPATGTKMTAAELVVAREFLGVTGPWFARAVRANARTQRRWEAGDSEVSANAEALVTQLAEASWEATDRLITYLTEQKNPGVALLRTDDDYQAAAPAGCIAYPARWHHHVAARAALEVPAVTLAFVGEKAPAGQWIQLVVSTKRADTGEAVYTTALMDYPSWKGRQG